MTIAGYTLNEENTLNWDHPLMRGCVSRWKAIGGTSFYGGNQLRDLAFTRNKRNNGTLTNGPTWQGPLGRPGGQGSLRLKAASSQYVSATWPLGSGNAIHTISAWINVTSTSQNPGYDIFSYGNQASNEIALCTVQSNSLIYSFYSPDLSVGFTSVNAWNHVVCVYQSGDRRLYLNGNLKASDAASSLNLPSGKTLRFGRRDSAIAHYDGLLDDICIFNRAIATAEVAALYDDTRQPQDPTLNWLSSRSYFTSVAESTDVKSLVGGGVGSGAYVIGA